MGHLWDVMLWMVVDGMADGCTVPSMGWDAAAGGVRALRLNPEGERYLDSEAQRGTVKVLAYDIA